MAEDALSNLLKTARLTGATFFDIEAQDPWAVRSPAPASILPRILPGADHLISYHVVTAGRCFARIVGEQPIVVEAGEVVVFTHSDPHIMSSSPGLRADPPAADVLDIAFAGQMPFHINYVHGGPISVKKALSLIHDQPACNWTIEALARQSGLSRTILAERFAKLVGIPPMHYLAKWRMQIASELLSGSNANIASIAAKTGYESDAAFSRAFKKMIGIPPSAWRLGVRPEGKAAAAPGE
jgi:AraC-like DNA-binding protein